MNAGVITTVAALFGGLVALWTILSNFDRRNGNRFDALQKENGDTRDSLRKEIDLRLPRLVRGFEIAYERWHKQVKEPEDQKDLKGWTAYSAEYRKQQEIWTRTFTEVSYMRQSSFFAAMNDPALTESDAVERMHEFLPSSAFYDTAASILLDRHWQPARALELMQKAREMDRKEQALLALDDNRAESGLFAQSDVTEHLELIGDFLRRPTSQPPRCGCRVPGED